MALDRLAQVGAARRGTLPSGAGTGTVTNTGGNLTASAIMLGAGLADSKVLGSLGTTTTVLHGNAAGNPSWGAVSLTADVSGILPVANGGTATSTAFTAGSAIFAGASGVYSQDNAKFFWDETNKRLGIGTATPDAPLNISGTAGVGGFSFTVGHFLGNATAAQFVFESNSKAGAFELLGATGTLNLYAGLGGVFTLNTSGQVGIGQQTPTVALDVGAAGEIRSTDGTVQTFMQSSSGGGGGFIGTRSNDLLTFRTNNTDKLTISGAGIITPLTPINIAGASTDGIAIGDNSWVNSTNLHAGWGSGQTTANWNLLSTGNAHGKSPGLFSIRSSDVASGALYVGLTSIAANDLAAASGANTAYALYLEAYKQAGTGQAGSIQALEIDVVNRYSGGATLVDPYRPNGDGVTGLAEGIRLTCGTLGSPTQYDCSVGLNFYQANQGMYWRTGINFGQYAIKAPTSTDGDAIALASGQTISWFSSAGVKDLSLTNSTGKLSCNITGSSASCTGNAATASSAATLTTARNIGGVSFNGSADIIPIILHGQAGTGGATNVANNHYLYWRSGGTSYLEIWIDNVRVANLQYNGGGAPATLVNN